MEKELQESQAKLDALQAAIVANKKAREDVLKPLLEESYSLRDQYIAEEKTRERLLKEVLGGKK